MNKSSNKLTYSSQLKFKKWARRHGASMKNGADFYFDCITGVDGRTQHDIKGLFANGKMTWGQALDIVKKHFKINA